MEGGGWGLGGGGKVARLRRWGQEVIKRENTPHYTPLGVMVEGNFFSLDPQPCEGCEQECSIVVPGKGPGVHGSDEGSRRGEGDVRRRGGATPDPPS